jgi:hypothetical protein
MAQSTRLNSNRNNPSSSRNSKLDKRSFSQLANDIAHVYLFLTIFFEIYINGFTMLVKRLPTNMIISKRTRTLP